MIQFNPQLHFSQFSPVELDETQRRLQEMQAEIQLLYFQTLPLKERCEVYQSAKKQHPNDPEAVTSLMEQFYGKAEDIGALEHELESIDHKVRELTEEKKIAALDPRGCCKLSRRVRKEANASYLFSPTSKQIYMLEKKNLGRSSMGKGPHKVKKAICLKSQKPVAVKIFRGGRSDLEVEILRRLEKLHDHFLVPSYKHKEVNQIIILNLEPGVALNQLTLPLTQDERRLIFTECKRQIEELHRKGIIHCDLKADNILYDREKGRVSIIDFGMSKLFARKEGGYTLQFWDGSQIVTQELDTIDNELERDLFIPK